MSTTPPDHLRLLAAHALADDPVVERPLNRAAKDALSDIADRLRLMIVKRQPDFGEDLTAEQKETNRELRWLRDAVLDLGHEVYAHVIPDAAERKRLRELERVETMRRMR